MPTVDKRNTDKVLQDGSITGLQVKLSDTEAQSIYGTSAVAGWYAFAETQQSEVGREKEAEDIKNEAGEIVKKVSSQDEGLISATLLQTDAATMQLVDLLADDAHLFRIAYPVGETDVSDGSGSTTTIQNGVQLYGLRNARVDPNFTMTGQAGETRTRDIEVRGSKKDGNPALVYDDVDPDEETNWPAELADFKSA